MSLIPPPALPRSPYIYCSCKWVNSVNSQFRWIYLHYYKLHPATPNLIQHLSFARSEYIFLARHCRASVENMRIFFFFFFILNSSNKLCIIFLLDRGLIFRRTMNTSCIYWWRWCFCVLFLCGWVDILRCLRFYILFCLLSSYNETICQSHDTAPLRYCKMLGDFIWYLQYSNVVLKLAMNRSVLPFPSRNFSSTG